MVQGCGLRGKFGNCDLLNVPGRGGHCQIKGVVEAVSAVSLVKTIALQGLIEGFIFKFNAMTLLPKALCII